jgi:hypothetical protein
VKYWLNKAMDNLLDILMSKGLLKEERSEGFMENQMVGVELGEKLIVQLEDLLIRLDDDGFPIIDSVSDCSGI